MWLCVPYALLACDLEALNLNSFSLSGQQIEYNTLLSRHGRSKGKCLIMQYIARLRIHR